MISYILFHCLDDFYVFQKNLNLSISLTNVSKAKFQYIVHLWKSYEYRSLIFLRTVLSMKLVLKYMEVHFKRHFKEQGFKYIFCVIFF